MRLNTSTNITEQVESLKDKLCGKMEEAATQAL